MIMLLKRPFWAIVPINTCTSSNDIKLGNMETIYRPTPKITSLIKLSYQYCISSVVMRDFEILNKYSILSLFVISLKAILSTRDSSPCIPSIYYDSEQDYEVAISKSKYETDPTISFSYPVLQFHVQLFELFDNLGKYIGKFYLMMPNLQPNLDRTEDKELR
ncbi:unnamed protein product, partial [Mucor hiemalis]